MKRLAYHLSGASLLVGVWRTLLWLFAWPLALYGHIRRRHKREHREIVAALANAAPQPDAPVRAARDNLALAEQKEREAETATGWVRKVLLIQAAALRKRA